MRIPQRQDRVAMLEAALDQGIRHFDVARSYGLGAAEAELGRVLRSRRDHVTVATKFGLGVGSGASRLATLQAPVRKILNRYPSLRSIVRSQAHHVQGQRRYDPKVARESLERSLRELRTDYVDLFLVHDPPVQNEIDIEPLASYLDSAQAAGHIRSWGFAGEAAACSRLAAASGRSCVLQFSRDIFSPRRSSAQFGPDPAIVFGVVSRSLPRLIARLENAAGQLDTDVLQKLRLTGNLAPLLVLDALDVGARDVVLFSTTSHEHLQRVTDAAASPDARVRECLSQLRYLLDTTPSDSATERDSDVRRR